MKRRIWFALTAVTAGSFALSAVAAGAATNSGSSAAKPIVLSCRLSLTIEPPQGDNAVAQPAAQGSQYGPIHCHPGKVFGGGIAGDSFTVPDSGDTVGKYTQYFSAGTVKGSFDITPQESNFSSTSFESQTWRGTIKVLSGTGIYKGIKGKKLGTMNCSSPDSVHVSCTEKVKLKTL